MKNHNLSEEKQKLLLERIPLLGLCRILEISYPTLLKYMTHLYLSSPKDLNVNFSKKFKRIFLTCLELNELCSFVWRKKNKQWVWVWIAFEAITKQVIAVYIGDRSSTSAQQHFDSVPETVRNYASFYTDHYEAYKSILPEDRHDDSDKGFVFTNGVERINCTIRQRCSRFIRKALSFSRKLWNHIQALRFFLCHYNTVKYQEYIDSQEISVLTY